MRGNRSRPTVLEAVRRKAVDAMGIHVRGKAPADPFKKSRVRPLVHFPIELTMPKPPKLPPLPKEGR